ncbi:MAG: hypothetical protein ABW034_07475 [Steroidobacteraceae bacterium]
MAPVKHISRHRTRQWLTAAYDTVRCDQALPGTSQPPEDAWFQTKDLEGRLETYTITRDGRLKGPYGFLQISGSFRFHAFEHSIWFEYEAHFLDGHLEQIDVIRIDRST